MNYEIIATGSKGNSVIIEDIMIDCGVPFQKIKDKLYDVRVLLLTHIHSDHVNPRTLSSINRLFPHIEIFGNYEVCQQFPDNDIRIINAGYEFKAGHYDMMPFECLHDVLTYGFTWRIGEKLVLYATDTCSMEFAPVDKYDAIFIESNHDEKKLEMAMNNVKGGYNPYVSGKRHLSTQMARQFYYVNRKDRDALFVELHQSGRFY